MFVRYFVELPLAHEIVAERLEADPQSWLPPIAGSASEDGEAMLAEVGFGERPRIARRVVVETGTVAHLGGATVLPFTPMASSGAALFPRPRGRPRGRADPADADTARDQRGVRATPRPRGPGGRALLHRVAEATLKDFLERVATRLAERAGDERPASVSG